MAPRGPLSLRSSTRAEHAAVLALAGLAAALSVVWQLAYLRGGPRIVDAATYLHEGALLAQGELRLPVGDVPASVLGRFLVPREEHGVVYASPIFPPGWPAALAVGFLLRAPFAVGPAVAALLVLVTWELGRELDRGLGGAGTGLAAAVASALCAALRYHTADPMSHGWVALLGGTALLAGARARAPDAPARWAVLSGLALGWAAATRPFSALPLAVGWLAIVWGSSGLRASRLASVALGALPPLALLAAHAHASTGSWLGSSQRLYYALADGPPGCFRWGFGEGVGCLGEHGDFVRARLPRGYGLLEAAGTTARRVWMHLLDVLNAEPSFLLVLVGAARARATRLGRALIACVSLQPLVYAPFYFDGNYPGGGARMLVDVLPLEHVLLAAGAPALLERLRLRGGWRGRTALLVGLLALLGFGARAASKHAALRERDGGGPEVALGALRDVPRGAVVFVEGDAGFSTASALGLAAGVEVRRWRGGLLDRSSWEGLGSPPSFLLRARRAAVPWIPPAGSTLLEGEDLTPARTQTDGYALAEWERPACSVAPPANSPDRTAESFGSAATNWEGRGPHDERDGARSARALVLRATGSSPAAFSFWLPSAERLGPGCVALHVHGVWPVGAWVGLGAAASLPAVGACEPILLGQVGASREPTVLHVVLPAGGLAALDAITAEPCARP